MKPTPVGLDIGSGFVKISTSNKRLMIPSLINRMILNRGGPITTMTGNDALARASHRHSLITRPVKCGVPYDDDGYRMLVSEAFKKAGVDPANAYVILGAPCDPNDDITTKTNAARIVKIVKNAVKPYKLRIMPRTFGTLKCCGRKEGSVIDIGHETTEIISLRRNSRRPKGFLLEKGSEFVTSQIGSNNRMDYVNYERIFEESPAETARFVGILAAYMADDMARMHMVEPIILAGGGSRIPGIKEAIEGILKRKVAMPENPVYANAVGYEMIAGERCKNEVIAPRR